MTTPQDKIRNFSIIAHIDHGKSTLADRLLEMTGALTARERRSSSSTRWTSSASAGSRSRRRTSAWTTPRWRPDLPAEPDRHARPRRLHLRGLALAAACEGAVLVVDATQGVEAQTLANVYLALDQGLEIIPFLNKVDLPSCGRRRDQGADRGGHRARLLGRRSRERRRPASESRTSSGESSSGAGAEGKSDAPLRALIFDSWYDSYRGGWS